MIDYKEILMLLAENYQKVGVMLVILIVSMLGNTALGVGTSKVITKDYNLNILKNGLKRGGLILLGLICAVFVTSTLPVVVEIYNLPIEEFEAIESFSSIIILILLGTNIIGYTKGIFEKLNALKGYKVADEKRSEAIEENANEILEYIS